MRAQTDGLDQVALAIAAKPAGASAKPSTTTAKAKVPAGSAPDEPAQKAKPPPSKDDKSRVLVVSTILSSLLRPVLPEPERFMVVDAGQPTLPVLFHSVTARAGVESLTRQADLSRSEVAALGSLTVGHPDRQRSFTTVYEGRNTVFVAKGIPGTRWVLLVFYALDDVDTIAGWTAARALSSWAALFVPAMLIGFGLLLAYKGRLRRLWPFEAAKELYRDGARNFVAVALVIAALALAPPLGLRTFWFHGPPLPVPM